MAAKRDSDGQEPEPAASVGPEALKRERAGTYRTVDGRFTIEQSSSGWLLLDAEQTDDLGLPLTRGPFGTLDEARSAIAGARSGPQPTSGLADRLAAAPAAGARETTSRTRRAPADGATGASAGDAGDGTSRRPGGAVAPPSKPARSAPKPRPATPPLVIRELRTADGPELRRLWAEAGFSSMGDDDRSLARLVRRNPGLVLVAAEGGRIVGSALGAWDGRRGWIYHVATAATHRRKGVATRLIRQVEAGLRDLGAPRVSVMVRDENDDGRAFWDALGYERAPTRQYRKVLDQA